MLLSSSCGSASLDSCRHCLSASGDGEDKQPVAVRDENLLRRLVGMLVARPVRCQREEAAVWRREVGGIVPVGVVSVGALWGGARQKVFVACKKVYLMVVYDGMSASRHT